MEIFKLTLNVLLGQLFAVAELSQLNFRTLAIGSEVQDGQAKHAAAVGPKLPIVSSRHSKNCALLTEHILLSRSAC